LAMASYTCNALNEIRFVRFRNLLAVFSLAGS
jgi:hypothetical protein